MAKYDRCNEMSKRPCVWVSAGVLVSGLCDRDFDCDQCPLHHALAHSAQRPARLDSDWPRDCRYTGQQLWVRKQSETAVRVGLTPFGAEILNPVKTWRAAKEDEALAPDAPFVVADTAAGEVALALPFGAEGFTVNSRIGIDPLWPIADPWETGYLAELSQPDWSAIDSACEGLEQACRHMTDQKRLVGDALQAVRHADLSQTRAADGGLPVTGLAQILGRSVYRRLLAKIFGVKVT